MKTTILILAAACLFLAGAITGYKLARITLEREVIELNRAFYGLK